MEQSKYITSLEKLEELEHEHIVELLKIYNENITTANIGDLQARQIICKIYKILFDKNIYKKENVIIVNKDNKQHLEYQYNGQKLPDYPVWCMDMSAVIKGIRDVKDRKIAEKLRTNQVEEVEEKAIQIKNGFSNLYETIRKFT